MGSLLTAVRTAYSVASSGVRHAAWYLRYQVDGDARAKRQPPRPRRASSEDR